MAFGSDSLFNSPQVSTAKRGLPDANGSVVAGTQQTMPIGCEVDVHHDTDVTLKTKDAGAAFRLPQPNLSLPGAAGQTRAVGTEVNRLDDPPMSQ